MRYSALAAVLIATLAVANPVENVKRYDIDAAAETPCTDDIAAVPTYSPHVEEVYTTVTAAPVTRYVTRRKGHHGYKTVTHTRKYKPTPIPTYVPEPEPTYVPDEPVYPTPPGKSPVGDAPSGSFDDECLKVHNEYRAMHGAGPLEWDNEMANHASGVSGTCVFEHSGGPYGENLAAGYDSAAAAIKDWYDENTLYDYATGDFSSGTGHFTQVVWKGAKKVGCAIVTCDGQNGTPGKFLTCNYDTGNVIGHFQENVLPPVGKNSYY